jgi:hypothetical protein
MPARHSIEHQPPPKHLIPVNSDAEIPRFADACEEAEFWSTHSFGPGLLAKLQPIPPEGDDVFPPARQRSILRAHTRNLSVRFDLETLTRLRRLAKKKGLGYQTLLKQFVVERLYEEEKREGLVG